ncbi:MAG: putative DNA-binding domain-containing protein [Vampirovibrionales bacterium]
MTSFTLALYQKLWLSLALDPDAEDTILKNITSFQTWLQTQPYLEAHFIEACLTIPLVRWQQYAFMVKANLEDTLKSVYPYTFQLLGDETNAVIRHYLLTYPPTHYLFLDCVEAFPESLQQKEPRLLHMPYLKDLARYEWAEAWLLKQTPTLHLTPMPDAVEAFENCIPKLNPHHYVLSSEYNIPAIVAELQARQNMHEDKPISIHVFERVFNDMSCATPLWIYLDTQGTCRFYTMNALVLKFLTSVKDNPTLSYLQHFKAVLGLTVYEENTQLACMNLITSLKTNDILL